MSISATCSAQKYNKDSVFVSEIDIRKRPKKSDIDETKALLRDFCINMPIPDFESLSGLYQWRKRILNGDYCSEDKSTMNMNLKKNPTGRPRKVSIESFEPYYKKYLCNQATRQQIVAELKISSNTFHLLARKLVQESR